MPLASSPTLHSFSHHYWATLVFIMAALIYVHGWLRLRRTIPYALPAWRAAAFFLGLLCAWFAVSSPLGNLDRQWLYVHMVQHLLLMTVSAPLILLGAPPLLFFYGLPQGFVHSVLGPFLRASPVQFLGRMVASPFFCWLAAMAVLIGWHIPASYSVARDSLAWHNVEHASFLIAGLLFWWPVVAPWPSVPRYSRWYIVLYLFLATLPCDALSAYLAFCDRVVYRCYLTVPHEFQMTALQDQQCAGALMWVFVTFAYLLPAAFLTADLLWNSEVAEQA